MNTTRKKAHGPKPVGAVNYRGILARHLLERFERLLVVRLFTGFRHIFRVGNRAVLVDDEDRAAEEPYFFNQRASSLAERVVEIIRQARQCIDRMRWVAA